MDFDRPVFQYPLIGADGATIPCVTIADFERLFEDALYWRHLCNKERDRLLATNCQDDPNVTCSKVVKTLKMFFSDMRACYIEERCRRSALRCQPTSEVQHSKLLQCSEQLQTDINVAQNELPVSPSDLASTTSAPQIHIPMIRQRFNNSSAMISFG